MAYVPGLSNDLFLSYAHEDVEWVSAFQEQLVERLLHRLGCPANVWQDQNNLRTGDNVPEEIIEAIQESAAFVAVLSRHYHGSAWCERELDTFLAQSSGDGGGEGAGLSRFLKVIKFPWHQDAHVDFYPDYLHVPFFERDPKTGQEKELKHYSAAFRDRVDKLSFHIEQLFEAMLRQREKVFVGRGTESARLQREALLRHVKGAGFALSPPPDGAIPQGLKKTRVQQYIADAGASVHLLGADFDQDVEEQALWAIEADKKVIFCLLSGSKTATGLQSKVVDAVRSNSWKLPDGKWALLENRSSVTLAQELIAQLAPIPAAAPALAEKRVYLACDQTTLEDMRFASEMQHQIMHRENIFVVLPKAATSSGSSTAQHEQLLADCDGLLVYFDRAPESWCKRSVADLLTAESRPRKRQLKSKAVLISRATLAIPGVTVIERRDPFDVQQLESFLAPLRSETAGAMGMRA